MDLTAAKDWTLRHKALVALIVVLLTLVPAVQKYDIVDGTGRGIEEYEQKVCEEFRSDPTKAQACGLALASIFGEQFAISEFYGDKQPLIPGLFHRRKVYIFRWNQQEFAAEFNKMYSFVKSYNR